MITQINLLIHVIYSINKKILNIINKTSCAHAQDVFVFVIYERTVANNACLLVHEYHNNN
jgi:hypothetical protein